MTTSWNPAEPDLQTVRARLCRPAASAGQCRNPGDCAARGL